MIEVGTIFVYPGYQGNGVGDLLLQAIYNSLQKNGLKEFCLDSGYKQAQIIWKKKFGAPDYLIKNYWGKGNDHMIWKIKVDDCVTE